ncbi:MAG TPA: nitroreductase family deazaflavin-dependent oxidoreductase [Thermoleophilaceae bacterium]|nr:nitroreductase family deazaflavin-dependent oxidoreductase [Thermoleophilaceae bacterium]
MSTGTARRRQLNGIERLGERFAQSKAGSWFYINIAMRVDRVLLPLSRGRLSISVGQQVGMLESVGAKSGEPRRTPLTFIRDQDHVVLIASKGGAPRHPAWLHNLRANPRVKFLGPGGATGEFVAREAEGDERARLWDEAVDYYAGYATYKVRAGKREIPIVVLERV